jgi:hypothetical protein
LSEPSPAADAALAPSGGWPSLGRSLAVAAATTAVVTLVSYFSPDDYANTGVGIAFLAITWWLVLRSDTQTARAYGLSLGGLTEPEPLESRRLLGGGARALAWALAMAAIFFPPFVIGYHMWWEIEQPFAWRMPEDMSGHVLGQLLVIALPEEAFFRGYLQSALDGRWARYRLRVLGADIGLGWLLSAAIFALGHLLTIPHPSRLGVFFPALLFGWLRARTGGVGAGVLFHAMCNMLTTLLAHGYGLV